MAAYLGSLFSFGPALGEPSIAVLPFTNMSDDQEQDYFVDGMTDDLITDLSKISGLVVIARNSTFAYKDRQVDVQTVARGLGVSHLLEGSVRRAGDQGRINTQLIDAATGGHPWAERYDDQMSNIFALQDRIANKVVAALSVRLNDGESDRLARKGTDNREVDDTYLPGWEHFLRDTPDNSAAAITFLEQVVQLDPDYARAHAALAFAYEKSIDRGWRRYMKLPLTRAWEGVDHHLQLAMRCPSSIAHQVKGLLLLKPRRQRYDKALEETERAIKLRPHTSHWALVAAQAQAGRIATAKESLKRYYELRKFNMEPTVSTMLTYHPYRRAEDRERLAQGLLAAGMCCHYDQSERNRLSGEEIAALFFGKTVTGMARRTAMQFWLTCGADGANARRGGGIKRKRPGMVRREQAPHLVAEKQPPGRDVRLYLSQFRRNGRGLRRLRLGRRVRR